MAAIGFSGLSLLLAFFIAIDTSDVYSPEVAKTFRENPLVGQTFTEQLPADTAFVFMTGNFGVCKSKTGIIIPLSELVAFAKEVAGGRALQRNRSEDLAMVDNIHGIARSFLRMFHGETGVALLSLPVGPRPPDFIVQADIDESEMSFAELMKKMGGVFGAAPASFVDEEGAYLVVGRRFYVQIKDRKLYASNSPPVIEQFVSGAWKANPLSQSPLYQEVGRNVQFDQEQFLFVNVERIWGEFLAAHDPMPGEMNTIASSLFGNLRAIASSMRLSNGTPDVRSTALFKDLTTGIPEILARPNARSQAASFVPQDYSVLVRMHTGSPLGLLNDMMGLNKAAARGMRRTLEILDKRLGLSIEEDVLPALAGDFAIAAKVPPMIGLPETLAVVRIADHDKAASVLETILEEMGRRHGRPQENVAGTSPAPPEIGTWASLVSFMVEYKGAKLRVVPLPLVTLTYTFVEGHLLVGSSPEVVKAAIDAHLSGQSLGTSKYYRAAFEGHPSESFATAYADSQAMFNGLLNIGSGLVLWKGPGAMRELIVPFIAMLRRNARDLSPVSWTVFRDGDAITARTNSRSFAAAPISLALPWLVLRQTVEVGQDIRRGELMLRREEEERRAEEMRLRNERLHELEQARKEQAIERAQGERR